MISETRKMQWTPWTARCWTGANCACRWRDTGARQIRITAAAEARRGGTGDMDGEAEAVVLGARSTAGLGPGAGAVPVAGPATADPGPTPDLGPVPAPKPAHHAEASPNRLPGPIRGLSPSLAPGAILLLDPTKDPNHDPDREADPNLQRILEPLLNPEIDVSWLNLRGSHRTDVRLRIPKLSMYQTERRSCVAVEFCWLAVKVACCGAECLAVSSILLIAPV